MNNNQFEIPIKIEVDTEEVEEHMGSVCSVLFKHAMNMMFGKKGLIRPEFETKFWIGQYYIDLEIH